MSSRIEVYTVEEIISAMKDEHDEIVIEVPPFQRGIVWSANSRSKLVDSLLMGFPIGSILLWESHRREDGKIVMALIDGLQRCTSLKMYHDYPTSHLQNNWLVTMEGYDDFISDFSEIENLGELLLDWIRDLDSFQEATAVNLGRFLENYLEIDTIYHRMERITSFCNSLNNAFSLLEEEISAIVYEGDRENLGEIFSRINKEGRPLSPLQIVAASWINTEIVMDLGQNINSEVAEKAKQRLLAFQEDGYEVMEFDEDNPQTYCRDLFQYLFGLGKLLIENGPNILPETNERDPDTIAFYLLGISYQLQANKLREIPDHTGLNPNLTSFATAALDATRIVSSWFNWLTDLNLNRIGDAPFIPHTQFQMISIIGRVMLEKFNPTNWEIRDSWLRNERQIKKVVRIKYLIDLLSNSWKGSGDANMFRHCWERIDPENAAPYYIRSPAYTRMPPVEFVETQLDSWFLSQMEGRQKTRATPTKEQKIAMKYVYSSLMSVRDNADHNYHIEHINSVAHMRLKISEENSDGWPMNCIANLMLLKQEINQIKQEVSVREFLRREQPEAVRQHISQFLISGVEEIPELDNLNSETYEEYCRNRWPEIKNCILTELGYEVSVEEVTTIEEMVAATRASSEAYIVTSSQDSPMLSEESINPIRYYANDVGEITPAYSPKLNPGTPKTPAEVTLECAIEIGKYLDTDLQQVSRAKFHSKGNEDHAFCTVVSKNHGDVNNPKFWFGCFDHQLHWFENIGYREKWYAFCCADSSLIFLCPLTKFDSWRNQLNYRVIKERGNKYWHVHLHQIEGNWYIITKKGLENILINEYMI
jgi:hypothetical protein